MQQKLFQLSGIAFVALVVVNVLVGGSTPGGDASAAEIASFYDENGLRQFIVPFTFAATVPFLVVFAIRLTGDAMSSLWGQVTIAGAILTGGAILATSMVQFALVDVADGGEASDAVLALNALFGSTWIAYNAGLGVLMLGAAGVLLSARVTGWLGWSALVLGAALFVPFADFVALLATLVWIVVTSIVLARGARETAFVAAAEPT